MDMTTFRKLPWPEMRKIIVRHNGIPIQDSCFRCGKKESQMREEKFLATMPDKYKHTKYGRLIWLYLLDEAQKERSKW